MTAPPLDAPLISVIIPTFNRAQLVTEAVESVLAQTWPHTEVVVVDDGSTDDTRSRLAPYLDRITYIHQHNMGRSHARNAGFALSSGECLVFLDSDDLLLPDALRLQATFLAEHADVDIVYANGFTQDEKGNRRPLEPYVTPTPPAGRHTMYAQLMRRNLFGPYSAMVRRRTISSTAPFDESTSPLEDWDLWIRLAIAGATIRYQDVKVCVYRRHSGNTNLDIRTELRSRIAIARNVIEGDLDSNLPARLRQDFRLEFLYAVLASRSPQLIVRTLYTILWPDHRFSLYGGAALPIRCGRMVARAVRLTFTRSALHVRTLAQGLNLSSFLAMLPLRR